MAQERTELPLQQHEVQKKVRRACKHEHDGDELYRKAVVGCHTVRPNGKSTCRDRRNGDVDGVENRHARDSKRHNPRNDNARVQHEHRARRAGHARKQALRMPFRVIHLQPVRIAHDTRKHQDKAHAANVVHQAAVQQEQLRTRSDVHYREPGRGQAACGLENGLWDAEYPGQHQRNGVHDDRKHPDERGDACRFDARERHGGRTLRPEIVDQVAYQHGSNAGENEVWR